MVKRQFSKNQMMLTASAGMVLVLLLIMVNISWLKSDRSLRAGIDHLKKEEATLEGFLDAFDKKKDRVILVDKNELSQVIDLVTKLGKEKNIDFITIQSQTPRVDKKGRYQKMPLQISVRSDFRELVAFLGALRNLEKATIVITEFKIERDEQPSVLVRGDVIAEVLLKNDEN